MSPLELRIFDFVGAHPLVIAIYGSLKPSFFLILIMSAALIVLLYVLERRRQPDQFARLTAATVALMILGELGITFGAVLTYYGYAYWHLPEPRVIKMLAALVRPDPWPWRPVLNFVPLLWVVGLTVVWMRQGRFRPEDLGFRRPDLSVRTVFAIIAGGWLALTGVALVWSLILPGMAAPSAARLFLEEMRAAQLPGASAFLMSWAVLVSIAEEILYRGVIYGALRQHLSVGVSLPVESLLFALAHGQWDRVVILFAGGCVLTYLYEWKGSLYIPILIHLSVQAGHVLYILMT